MTSTEVKRAGPEPAKRDLTQDQARVELRQTFDGLNDDGAYTKAWAGMWDRGDFLPWDKGTPSPALEDTLKNHAGTIGKAMVEIDGKERRKRALVPGCGRGVDVLLLESYGYDVVGLEYSQTAVQRCEEHAENHTDDYPVKDTKIGKGSKQFVQGDFYTDDWLTKAGMQPGATFELIYDYTFFCAMPPKRRPAWAKRMSTLLGPSPYSNLICLEYPTVKPPATGGPPFASPPKAYMEHLSHPGKDVRYGADGHVVMDPLAPVSPGGFERVGHWHPADTHPGGKDEQGNVADYIGIWRHCGS